MIIIIIFFLISQLVIQVSHAEYFKHEQWDQLLKSHVSVIRSGASTVVDYEGFSQDAEKLSAYLDKISSGLKDNFYQWPVQEQLSFLINAYNAWTIKLVLTEYPDMDSIRDIGNFFLPAFSKNFIPLFNNILLLDDIEKEVILGSKLYNEFRVHFALNCASIGCPELRNEAYNSIELDNQLNDQMKWFLGDQTRNRMEDNNLKVSSIFKWYRKDFENSSPQINLLNDFFVEYSRLLNLSSADQDII